MLFALHGVPPLLENLLILGLGVYLCSRHPFFQGIGPGIWRPSRWSGVLIVGAIFVVVGGSNIVRFIMKLLDH